MDSTPSRTHSLDSLASYLSARQAAVLRAWRDRVDRDPELTAPSSLPRSQFFDHIPKILDSFTQRLRSSAGPPRDSTVSEHKEHAAAHGLQRWQQGYRLREVTREWCHLQRCLLEELARYAEKEPDTESGVLHVAYVALAELCNEGISESAGQYFDVQQIEAEGHVKDLGQALEQLRELERERAELWREAAHDLRGNLGVVVNATAGLTHPAVPPPLQEQLLRLLQKSVSSMHGMLDDVMSLARLQAGQERREVKGYDAARLLGELCDSFQPFARERGLYLDAEGPAELPVSGDAIKIRRIAQNLLLNALKYTVAGGVTVAWGDSRPGDSLRWMLSVRDTGPGYHAGPGAPLAAALEQATQESLQVEGEAAAAPQNTPEFVPLASQAPDTRAVHQERGEGVGLSIVKRLCDLVDATIEVESSPGEGTIFRVLVPRGYA